MNSHVEVYLRIITGFIVIISFLFLYFVCDRFFSGSPNHLVGLVNSYAESETHILRTEQIEKEGVKYIKVQNGDTVYVEYEIDRNSAGEATIDRYVDSCNNSSILLKTDVRSLADKDLGRKKVIYTFTLPKFMCSGIITIRTNAFFRKWTNPLYSLFPYQINNTPVLYYYVD